MKTSQTAFHYVRTCLVLLSLICASTRSLYSQLAASTQSIRGQLATQEPARTAQASRVDRTPKMDGTLDDPHEIWREDINRRGGLLGRPVELVCYDDHADALRVPGIYKKLMNEDKVDLVLGGYGTNAVLPAMPLIMERQRFFVGLMGSA